MIDEGTSWPVYTKDIGNWPMGVISSSGSEEFIQGPDILTPNKATPIQHTSVKPHKTETFWESIKNFWRGGNYD